MAQQVQVLLIDDLEGGDAIETVTFGLDGKSYEIDLNDKNNKKLRKALAPFIDAGRRAGKNKTVKKTDGDTAKVRAWARENGYEVNDRGRVPAEVHEAYAKAKGQ